ncbi:hypothetical protein N2152v2_003090 [Parachlorella kessleri]
MECTKKADLAHDSPFLVQMNKTLCLVAILLTAWAATASASGCTLYVDYNQGGSSKYLAAGDYPNLPQAGFPNDNLSSVNCDSSCTIEVYQDYNLQGRHVGLSSGNWNVPTDLNDQASSVSIMC